MNNYWSSGCGRIELQLDLDDAAQGSHPGPCDADIAELRAVPYIAEQLAALDPALVSDILREYGAWDDAERAIHQDNLDRLLWIACGDLTDMEVLND